AGDLPQTKATSGSNFCDVAVRVDGRAGIAVAMAALDNLVKGASGQAVQNMNVMFGLAEETGLRTPGLYP
ncbi:MAG TPA: N-acetyl-gamma-glutamyl-phosphate reductase, partial [bacterium]|nr:N-acetyl-gamma-glutamyl-phosphate reductase [bacterium]